MFLLLTIFYLLKRFGVIRVFLSPRLILLARLRIPSAKTLPQDTKHSLYADDLAIWSSSPDPLNAAQKALDHLEEWSLKWCLSVNPAKCECCFFSTNPHQASHQPNSL